MSAQTLNGVRIGGNALQPSIINQSDKPMIGYVVQRIGDCKQGEQESDVALAMLAALPEITKGRPSKDES